MLFAIQQKYDFSSKSQHFTRYLCLFLCCLQYSKSTIFQANHNCFVCGAGGDVLFAIQQKYDFSSKSQQDSSLVSLSLSCLQYSKSTIFQANHNPPLLVPCCLCVVCNTAKVRFFKQITTVAFCNCRNRCCLQYSKSTIFQANHNYWYQRWNR